MEGKREETSKLAGDSGSRRSTLMVRQLIVAMIAREDGKVGVGRQAKSSAEAAETFRSASIPLCDVYSLLSSNSFPMLAIL